MALRVSKGISSKGFGLRGRGVFAALSFTDGFNDGSKYLGLGDKMSLPFMDKMSLCSGQDVTSEGGSGSANLSLSTGVKMSLCSGQDVTSEGGSGSANLSLSTGVKMSL